MSNSKRINASCSVFGLFMGSCLEERHTSLVCLAFYARRRNVGLQRWLRMLGFSLCSCRTWYATNSGSVSETPGHKFLRYLIRVQQIGPPQCLVEKCVYVVFFLEPHELYASCRGTLHSSTLASFLGCPLFPLCGVIQKARDWFLST